uniref:AMP-dependent synthetase/ligase domain-containing protein n=1 Tax=Anopheles christyi TaxID=43041 RepID=A0A182K5K1_9DIPT
MTDYRTVYDEATRTWYGPTVKHLFNPEASLGQIMLEVLSRSPDRVMQQDMDTGRSLTYGEFRMRLIRFAQNLTEAGVRRGDMVALANANSENLAPLACALLTIGVPFNPLAPTFNEHDMANMLRTTKPKLVFADADNYEVVRKALERTVSNGDTIPPIYVFECTRGDVKHAEDLMKKTGREERATYLGDSNKIVAAVLCSSGTSGAHKGVQVTHAAIMQVTIMSRFVSARTVHFTFSALYWTTGFSTMLNAFFNGATRLITRQPFNEELLLKAVEKCRANAIFVPTAYANTMMAYPRIKTADLSSLKVWALGGSPVPEELRDRIDALLAPHGGYSVNAYGSSENGGIAIDMLKRTAGAIGPLMPNVIVRVVDEEGNRMGVGERGELLTKTNVAFGGYYGNEEASTSAIDSEGFLRTGDIGYIDEQGLLYLVDRKKDIFKYRGYHVSPTDLEAIIMRIEGVQDVCVVGVPDAEGATDLPSAVIVRRPGSKLDASQVCSTVAGQVSDFKRLRGGVHFIAELPKTDTGKVLRRKVTEIVASMNQHPKLTSMASVEKKSRTKMELCTYDANSRTWYGVQNVSIYNPKTNVGEVLNHILLRTPDRIIQIDMDTDSRLSCAEFRMRMIRFAQHLTDVGLRKGDIVAMANGNSENVAPLACALMTLGAPFNPLAPGFNVEDMAHMLRLTQPKIVFCDEANVEVVRKAVRSVFDGEIPIYVFESKRDDVRHAEDLLKPTGREEQFIPAHLGDSHELLSMIVCSSGTTGPPKGVCVTHAQTVATIGSYPMAKPMTVFNFSPLYWGTGVYMLLSTFSGASTRLITRRPFSEETFFEAVEKYRANFAFMPPSYGSQIARHERAPHVDFSSLRMLSLGGSYVSDGLRDRLDRLLPNGRTYNSVGTSEIGWVSCDLAKRKPGSVGTPVINIAIKIVDDAGNDLGVGEQGQVLLKGSEPFIGYYKNEEATRATIDERGFTRSGDVGYVDEEGYLYLIDREKDIFKYRGFHISPSELEAIIGQIEGVLEVCVVGVPADEERTTELPTAAIVRAAGSSLTAEQVMEIVDGKVSDFKRLRGGVYFVDHLPKTQSGKNLRRKVLSMVLELVKDNTES